MELAKLIETLNTETKQAVERSAFACIERKGIEITLEDLLLALLDEQTELTHVLAQFDIDIDRFRAALHFELDTRTTVSSKPVFSDSLLHTLKNAWLLSSLELSLPFISAGSIVLALLNDQLRYGRRRYIEMLSVVSFDQLKVLIQGRYAGDSLQESGDTSKEGLCTAPPQQDKSVMGEGILSKVTTSLTDLARNSALDPVIGRDTEIRQAIDILCRRRKNNPILLGEAGVGKTAIVEGLAQKIVDGKVPQALKDVDLRLLDIAALQAGASVKGEFERRITALIEAIQTSLSPIVLFIDEAHLMVGAGANEGGGDVANLIKPALARGALRTIAATTLVEYKRYIEKDPALVRRFQSVKVAEPSVEETVTLLRGLRERYAAQHGVYIRDDALISAASLSSRYLTGRQLPDKAIDLIDTACASVKVGLAGKPASVELLEQKIETVKRKIEAIERDALNDGYDSQDKHSQLKTHYETVDSLKLQLVATESIWQQERDMVNSILICRDGKADKQNERRGQPDAQIMRELREDLTHIQGESPLVHYEVSAQQVSEVLAAWTGIPAGKMLMDEAQKLGELSTQLETRVKGQGDATTRIGELLCQARVGLNDPNKPLGVFLLVGPSGVGKTETALTIADTLFGGEKYLTTINMSEFQEKHTISRLIGSPPGYVGYGEGGVLTEAVRQKPFSVVLLDEVEKADPNVLNIFYQVFDKGVMNDGEGRLIDFRNTVVVLTSNLASDQIETLCSSDTDSTSDIDSEVLLEKIRPTLNDFFKPALLARMEVLTYRPLEQCTLRLLVESKLEQLVKRLRTHGTELTITGSVLDAITNRCVLVEAGARHIDRLINQHITSKLSKLILFSVAQQTELSEIYLSYEEGVFTVSG
ncbi:type VI secretion system ATPase TssH [Alkalimarinus alittae]|uniref:Type VI secretion system ATPase TssH n=1 Tax=Alkalimarinus alittae TaxID=2961619 RepID=A0ABY6MZ30_9ALTE|nr:type VI secretion system ATPase TssH [Alkalimarinus alittae]UZE95101.1 type VI secretion system ATPase TssH [Alkalimarinus alittae]